MEVTVPSPSCGEAAMYRDGPDGMAGNEDCGQMSAWFVLSALGFYSVDPVSGDYVVGTPLFDQAEIEVGRYSIGSSTLLITLAS